MTLVRSLWIVVWVWAAAEAAAEDATEEAAEPCRALCAWHGPERAQERRPQLASVHPDAPVLRYAVRGGLWNATAGGRVVLFGRVGPNLGLEASWDGLLDLHNVRRDFPVPWELYRAHVGFQLLVHSRALEQALPGEQQIDLQLGWFHESDHAANVDGFFGPPTPSPGPITSWGATESRGNLNGNMSSFELWQVRAVWQWRDADDRMRLQLAPTLRIFPDPINGGSERRMTTSGALEASASLRAFRRGRVQLSAFAERVGYERGSAEVQFADWDGQATHHAMLELGYAIESGDRLVFMPHLLVEDRFGRGIDWGVDYGAGWGLGFRATL